MISVVHQSSAALSHEDVRQGVASGCYSASSPRSRLCNTDYSGSYGVSLMTVILYPCLVPTAPGSATKYPWTLSFCPSPTTAVLLYISSGRPSTSTHSLKPPHADTRTTILITIRIVSPSRYEDRLASTDCVSLQSVQYYHYIKLLQYCCSTCSMICALCAPRDDYRSGNRYAFYQIVPPS
jgi:hypothetical protein